MVRKVQVPLLLAVCLRPVDEQCDRQTAEQCGDCARRRNGTTMNAATDPVIAALDAAAHQATVAEDIADALGRVTAQLDATDRPMTWERVPLSVFGGSLPSTIRSCWIFVLRAGPQTGPERHPNSHQRSVSLVGAGTFEVREQGQWTRHPQTSGTLVVDGGQWVSIPPNTWHRLTVGSRPWGMLSFHTVEATALVEEVPLDPEDLDGATEQHLYTGP